MLKTLLERHAPCVVLIDELVAYIRQFSDSQVLSGGTYDSNLSFVQALTEAAKLVPNALLLASLPESEVEAGSSKGQAALAALEKTFGRVQALWKPSGDGEAFESPASSSQFLTRPAGMPSLCASFVAEGASFRAQGPLSTPRPSYPIHRAPTSTRPGRPSGFSAPAVCSSSWPSHLCGRTTMPT